MAEKMVVICNTGESTSVMPTLIFSTSGAALDYEVHVFFGSAAAQTYVF